MATVDDRDTLLTTDEAAKMLGLHAATLCNWRSAGISPFGFIRLGRRSIRYKLSVIRKYLDDRMTTN